MEPIKWNLQIFQDKVCAVTNVILESRRMNPEFNTWENSVLQTYLNHDFIITAGLTGHCQAVTHRAENYLNVNVGNEVSDLVWIPSWTEIQALKNTYTGADYYKASAYNHANEIGKRSIKCSDFARGIGTCDSGQTGEAIYGCYYFLRSEGSQNDYQSYVAGSGYMGYVAYSAHSDYGIVPAFFVNLPSIPAENTTDYTGANLDLQTISNVPDWVTDEMTFTYYQDGNLVTPRAVGTYDVVVTYGDIGTYRTKLIVQKQSLASATVTYQEEYAYTGSQITLADLVVKVNDVTLTAGTDYEVTYTNAVDAGTAAFTIKGINNYTGTKLGNFTINKKVITRPAHDENVYTYDGTPQTYFIADNPDYRVTDNVYTNAGNYYVKISLLDPDNCTWDDNTYTNLSYPFNINPKVVTVPMHQKIQAMLGNQATIDLREYYNFVNDSNHEYYVDEILTENVVVDDYYLPVSVDVSLNLQLKLTSGNYIWSVGHKNAVISTFAVTADYTDNAFTGTLTVGTWDYLDTPLAPQGITAKYGAPVYYYTQDLTIAETVLPAASEPFNLSDWKNYAANLPIMSGDYYVIAYVPALDDSGKTYYAAMHSDHYALARINKIAVTKPAADPSTFQYNGTAQTYTIATSELYMVLGNQQTAAGEHTVTLVLHDKDNYIWAHSNTADDEEYAFNIAPIVLELTFAIDEKTYDTTTTADGQITLGNLVAGDEVTVTGDFVWASAAVGEDQYYVRNLTVVDNTNYILPTDYDEDVPHTAAQPIAKGILDLMVTMANWYYGDEISTPVVTAKLGAVTLDDLTIFGDKLQFKYATTENGPYATVNDLSTLGMGNYFVQAAVREHPYFHDVTAVAPFAVSQVILAGELGSAETTIDGLFSMEIVVNDTQDEDRSTTIAYGVKILRNGNPLANVNNFKIKLLVPPAITNQISAVDQIDMAELMKNLRLDHNRVYELVVADGKLYAEFEYSGAAETEFVFVYQKPYVPSNRKADGLSFNIIFYIGLVILILALLFIIARICVRMSKRKKAKALA